MIYATPVAADPRDYARAARRSAAIAAPLARTGAGLVLAAVTFMDPAKAGSVPEALSGGALWLPADRVLVGLGLAVLTAAAVLALTSLRDRRARLRLGRALVSDGGYALAVFVVGPVALTTLGHYPLTARDWAWPGQTLIALTAGMTAVGAILLTTSRGARHRDVAEERNRS